MEMSASFHLLAGRESYVENALWDVGLLGVVGLVISIRVQSVICNNVVLKDGLEILLAGTAEQEGVNSRTKLLKCKVRWSEKSTSDVVGGVVKGFDQTGLAQSKFQCAELAGQKVDDLNDLWWRD